MTPVTSPVAAGLRFRDRVRTRSGSVALLVFRVGAERFALELRAVEEVVEHPDVRPVPGTGAGVLGMFRHGDRLLSLYDPAPILGVAAVGNVSALVLRAGSRRLGLAVDEVEDVTTRDFVALRSPPDDMGDDILVGVLIKEPTLVGVLDARALSTACLAGPVPSDL